MDELKFILKKKLVVLLGGLGLFLLMLVMPTPEGVSPEGQRMAAVAMLMALWWIGEAVPLKLLGIDAATLLDPISQIPVAAIGGMLLGTTNAIVDLLSQSLLVLIFMIYLLIGRETADPATEASGPSVWKDIEQRIERYIATKALVSGATGLLVGTVLSLFGIDLALVFGLFAFLLNFIPSVGSLIATLLPLPVVLVSPEISTATAVAGLAGPGIAESVHMENAHLSGESREFIIGVDSWRVDRAGDFRLSITCDLEVSTDAPSFSTLKSRFHGGG